MIVSTAMRMDLDLVDAIRWLHSLGVDRIEVSHAQLDRVRYVDVRSYVDKVRNLVSDLGIEIPAAHLPVRRDLTEIRRVEEVPRIVDELRRWIEELRRLGTQKLVVHTLWLSLDAGISTWKHLAMVARINAKFFDELSRTARDLGIEILVENRVEKGYYGSTAADLLEIVEGREGLGICLDVGHAHAAGISIEEFVEIAKPWIRALHLHDNDGTRDQHLPPLLGTINWRKIVSLINYIDTPIYEVACSNEKCRNYIELIKLFHQTHWK